MLITALHFAKSQSFLLLLKYIQIEQVINHHQQIIHQHHFLYSRLPQFCIRAIITLYCLMSVQIVPQAGTGMTSECKKRRSRQLKLQLVCQSITCLDKERGQRLYFFSHWVILNCFRLLRKDSLHDNSNNNKHVQG